MSSWCSMMNLSRMRSSRRRCANELVFQICVMVAICVHGIMAALSCHLGSCSGTLNGVVDLRGCVLYYE